MGTKLDLGEWMAFSQHRAGSLGCRRGEEWNSLPLPPHRGPQAFPAELPWKAQRGSSVGHPELSGAGEVLHVRASTWEPPATY